jgi:hypothetical protein
MGKNTYHIHSNRRPLKQIYETLSRPCVYRAADYGVFGHCSGKGVRIAVIDTGVPDHTDIRNIAEGIDMSESARDKHDHHGHATMISGILTSANPRAITGIAPDADLLFAKAINTEGDCSYTAIVASVLWAIVKQVDIILISLGSTTEYSVLHDAIRKAYGSGIVCLGCRREFQRQGSIPRLLPRSVVGRSSAFGFEVLEVRNHAENRRPNGVTRGRDVHDAPPRAVYARFGD